MIGRARLALIFTAPALVMVVVVMVGSLATSPSREVDPGESTRAGIARIGDDVALVIVTDETGQPAASSVDWSLVAPILALIPAAGAAWLVAGRPLAVVERANAEIETADDERRTRLQEVVHELRNPLAVMGTNLELAAVEAAPAPDAVGYIDAARRAVDRMGRTVDDLDGHGRLAVEQEDGLVDLAALAEAVVSEHTGPLRARGIHVLVTGSAPTLVPAVDPAAIRTAIGNFLGNSTRLAPRGSAVRVDWGDIGDWAWIAVADEGPGLAPHLHARAFERGWRGPHDRNRGNVNGEAGLGLTIARQLTEAQGGAVTLDSEEGGGATLTVWLPLNHDADHNDVVAPDRVHPAIQPWKRDIIRA